MAIQSKNEVRSHGGADATLPWRVTVCEVFGTYDVTDNQGKCVAQLGSDDRAKSNAILMASAHAMLATLKLIKKELGDRLQGQMIETLAEVIKTAEGG